ncbi:hypothetical protein I79_018882 [Cricetulus griseus]|uniref:Uncharacterized protein n=1 Tax=Cricetulus griseus TaxID=10029 RepID=G3I5X1_CRIGR|nr:hypothetical protein I79_018882 [Cricetulus griseus]
MGLGGTFVNHLYFLVALWCGCGFSGFLAKVYKLHFLWVSLISKHIVKRGVALLPVTGE